MICTLDLCYTHLFCILSLIMIVIYYFILLSPYIKIFINNYLASFFGKILIEFEMNF